LNQTIKVRDFFMGLSARVRSRFENSPQKMIDFLDNPENLSEAVDLGLVPKDLSNLKYIREGVDVTDEIYSKRGFFINGVRVNKKGYPLTKEEIASLNGDVVENTDDNSGDQATT
jgi:hypothetical protein